MSVSPRDFLSYPGELGIVFFLFEMGLELSIARLNAMKKDVFGLGTMQFLLTSAAGATQKNQSLLVVYVISLK